MLLNHDGSNSKVKVCYATKACQMHILQQMPLSTILLIKDKKTSKYKFQYIFSLKILIHFLCVFLFGKLFSIQHLAAKSPA